MENASETCGKEVWGSERRGERRGVRGWRSDEEFRNEGSGT